MSPTGNAAAPHEPRADVELRVPADSAYVSVLRTTTVGLAARLDLTLDDIEDLRMSVGEAVALLLPLATPGSDLTCGFFLKHGELTVDVSVSATDGASIDHETFGWQVLSTLASDLHSHEADGRYALALTMRASHLDPSS
jgi:serine/threonine-protein kinase RsbW